MKQFIDVDLPARLLFVCGFVFLAHSVWGSLNPIDAITATVLLVGARAYLYLASN
jgi:hypothetical protein